jgi:hypothetical protein
MRDGRPVVLRASAPAAGLDALERLGGHGVPEVIERLAPDEAVIGYAPRLPMAKLTRAALRAVAATIARAHADGVVHGALDADCVLVAPAGAVLLDGWCGTGACADDVAAFGRILAEALPEDDDAHGLATRAMSPHPAVRPSMATIAAALGPRTPFSLSSKRGRRPPVAAALLATVAATAAALAIRAPWSASDPPDRDLRRPAAAPITGPHGEQVAVGGAGDVVIVGRWTCADSTPAVLDADGTIWLFRSWEAAAISIGKIDGATSLRARSHGACDELVAVVGDRDLRAVPLPPV